MSQNTARNSSRDSARPIGRSDKTLAKVTLRSMADALGKISARLAVGDDDETRSVLNEAGGKLIELANRHPSDGLAAPVSVQLL